MEARRIPKISNFKFKIFPIPSTVLILKVFALCDDFYPKI